jgi:predicted metal-binding membrane protein
MNAAASRADLLVRVATVALLVVLTALGWLWLYPMNMMPAQGIVVDGPPQPAMPWSPSKWIFLLVMWSVMMAAMMLPTAVGMILAVERMARSRGNAHQWLVTGAFTFAYVVVWSAFAGLATLAQWAAEQASLMSPMMASASIWMSGLVLVGAGLFQFSPLKHACLTRCRSPMGFLIAERRRGIGGAFVMGLRHGVFCVGCCWALMALFFVFGTMNLVVALALTALVLAEKMLPGGAIVARIAGGALVVTGLATLVQGFL